MNAQVHLPASMRFFERGWLSSNNILFVTQGDTALVDTGYVTHAQQTLALVRHELGTRTLDRIVNTHLHSDHCGGNALLQKTYGSHTSIPVLEAGAVADWDSERLSYAATGQQCPRFSFDATMNPGDKLELGGMPWQVLASPGHDPHSLILYCPEERILISADALWEQGFGVIFPELGGASGFAETRATLEMIAGLDIRLVIPGHGAMFTGVQQALEYAFQRLDYLQSDPVRNARNGMKVLLKFMLLERRQISLADAVTLAQTTPLLGEVNRRFLHQPAAALIDWAAAELVRAKAARLEDGWLLDAD